MKTLSLGTATYLIGRMLCTHPRNAVVLMEPRVVTLEYSSPPTPPAPPVVIEVANG